MKLHEWLIVLIGGVVVFLVLDWVLGTYLRIPNVRVGSVAGAIAWLLLSPLLFTERDEDE